MRGEGNSFDNRFEDIFDALLLEFLLTAESIFMNRLSLWLTLIFNDGVCFAFEVIGEVFLSFGAG